MSLRDRFGREIRGLRVSVTQRCNLDCIYCHREGEGKASERTEMSASEIGRLLKVGRKLGIDKLKLTGGEPLMRKDIVQIVREAARHMDEISLTTNGTLLKSKAKALRNAGLDRVNVSLDTLDPNLYRKLTGRPYLRKAVEGIESAVSAGLEPIKVNMVMMKGLNDSEIGSMNEFCRERNLVLQAIELEEGRGGENRRFFRRHHASLEPLEKELESKAIEVKVNQLHNRRKYIMPEGNVIEIVRPMHNSDFCMNCRRMRITSNGELKPCLLRKDNHVNVLDAVRNGSDETIVALFKKTVELREPYWR